MRKFSVKHMLGLSASPAALAAAAAEEEEKRKAAAAEDDGDDEAAKKSKSKSTESDDKTDDDGDDADDDADDSDREDDEDDDDEQAKAGRVARQQERERCGSIITSAEAEGRLALACHFAFNTGLSAKSAIASLKAAPKTQAAGTGAGLAAAMERFGNPKLGTDGKDAAAGADHGWDSAIARAEELSGRRRK